MMVGGTISVPFILTPAMCIDRRDGLCAQFDRAVAHHLSLRVAGYAAAVHRSVFSQGTAVAFVFVNGVIITGCCCVVCRRSHQHQFNNPITAAVEPITDWKLLYPFSHCFRDGRGHEIVFSTSSSSSLLWLNTTYATMMSALRPKRSRRR